MSKQVVVIDLNNGTFLGEYPTVKEADKALAEGIEGMATGSVYCLATVHKMYKAKVAVVLEDVTSEELKQEHVVSVSNMNQEGITSGDVEVRKIKATRRTSSPVANSEVTKGNEVGDGSELVELLGDTKTTMEKESETVQPTMDEAFPDPANDVTEGGDPTPVVGQSKPPWNGGTKDGVEVTSEAAQTNEAEALLASLDNEEVTEADLEF